MNDDYDWATTPLLDKANIGKYVLHSWNSNARQPMRIDDIKRTVIINGDRYRVEDDPAIGLCDGRWPQSIITNEAAAERQCHAAAVERLRLVAKAAHVLPLAVLEQMLALAEAAS